MLDGQCPLLDAQSEFRNLMCILFPLGFHSTPGEPAVHNEKKTSTLGTNTILLAEKSFLNIHDRNLICNHSEAVESNRQNGHSSRLLFSQFLSRPNPSCARSATALASVIESFSDSGRSSLMPRPAAYSRNR